MGACMVCKLMNCLFFGKTAIYAAIRRFKIANIPPCRVQMSLNSLFVLKRQLFLTRGFIAVG